MTDANLIEILCIHDEFCKYFTLELKKYTLDTCGKRCRNRPCRISDSKVMTILVLFHTIRHRDLKSFYLGYVCNHICREFPRRLSYNRFVERQTKVGLHLLLFLQTCALGKCTGISIIDSMPLVSCHIKRAHDHKTMRDRRPRANVRRDGSTVSSYTSSLTTVEKSYNGLSRPGTWTTVPP